MHTETIYPARVAPSPAAPATATGTLKILRATIKDYRQAKNHKSDDHVARVNDAVDRAYTLPIETLHEAAAMLRLILESEAEGLDPVVRRALSRVSNFLTGRWPS